MRVRAVLVANNVTKTFAGRRALDGVSLAIGAGEMVALIGASGSGKSTLLRGLAQLAPFDPGGACAVFGQDSADLGRDRARLRAVRTRLGFVAQSFNLVGRLSLFSNVAVGGLGRVSLWRGLLGAWPKDHVAKVNAAIARVGLADHASARASTLSGGQQQRGAVARAIAQGAELILADEPVASLDPVSGKRVMALLADLNEREGVGIVVSLHNIAMAQRYCRRIVALQAGRIVFDGAADALGSERLRAIYGPEIDDAL